MPAGFSWEKLVLIPVALIVFYGMLFVAQPFLGFLLPLFAEGGNYPMGWLYKFLIGLLPLVALVLVLTSGGQAQPAMTRGVN